MSQPRSLTLLVGSDLHNSREGFEWFCRLAESRQPALIVFLGDFVTRQPLAFTKEVLATLRSLAPHCFVIPGNWDPRETAVESDIAAFDGLRNLHKATTALQGYTFAGLGGSTTTPVGNTPLEAPDAGFATAFSMLLPVDVWLLHNPVYGFRDIPSGQTHVGSRSLEALLQAQAPPPLLVLSGHIHEAAGSEATGTTTFVNPGALANLSAAWIELVERDAKVEMLGTAP